jgi:beta-aspartyl-peptidase (threonine type)
MKPLVAVPLIVLLLATAEQPDAARAIRQVLDEQVSAWNKGDLPGFMAGYWQSPDLSFFSGKERTRGWQATLDRYRKKYQAEGREMGKLSFREIEVEMLTTDHALVKGRWELVLKKETHGGLFTLIMKKLTPGWRIVHDHTSS